MIQKDLEISVFNIMIYFVLYHNIVLKNAVYTAECEEKNELHKSCNQRLLPGSKRVQRARKILPGILNPL